ncbi:hypothetical protein KR067_007833 [Drosophila pandora]|nr:hypothetical protein KR067_007833 [Drosophila pandora]
MQIEKDLISGKNSKPLVGVPDAWTSSYHLGNIRGDLREADSHASIYGDHPIRSERLTTALIITKIVILMIVWCFFTFYLVFEPPEKIVSTMVLIQPNETLLRTVMLPYDAAEITLSGPIDKTLTASPGKAGDEPAMGLRVEYRDSDLKETYKQTDMWNVYLTHNADKYETVRNVFEISPVKGGAKSVISMEGKSEFPVALLMEFDDRPIISLHGVIYATMLLIGLYILVVFEVTDRTLAALLIASTALAILTAMGNRPTMTTIISWVDFETLMLLMGMMIMVAILSETGLFDWLAVLAYRVSMGQPWALILFLSLFTAVFAAFLDNVTMLLLMAPIAIRLCEAMALRVSLVLIIVVCYSNIGGTLTPVGDPPNVIICTNAVVEHDGIDFATFTLHMLPGVLLSLIAGYGVFYGMMRHALFDLDPKQIQLAREHEISRALPDEKTLARMRELMNKGSLKMCLKPADNYYIVLATLESQYQIRNVPLLIKSMVALIFTLACFLLHSLPFLPGATLGWVAVLAAFLLLILANVRDVEVILAQVEWSALLFLAALFVVTETVDQLGFISWLGEKTVQMILTVEKNHQLTVAILLIIWMSAILSAFVGNVPVTAMMLKLVVEIYRNEQISVQLSPLIWSLSYGVCLGGNGTIIGASANVVAAAIAHHNGYKISFMYFLLYGFPLMIVTTSVSCIYLLIAHSVFSWHRTEGESD